MDTFASEVVLKTQSGVTGFSYTYVDPTDFEFAQIDADISGRFTLRHDGETYGATGYEVSLAQLGWGAGRQTTALLIEFDEAVFFAPIAGDDVPNLARDGIHGFLEFSLLGEATDDAGQITSGPYRPGQRITFRELFDGDISGAPRQGTQGADTLRGTRADDLISAQKGADTAYGGTGDDTILMGRGDDRAYGGADDDALSGYTGADRLYGSTGDDLLLGMTGADRLYGGSGRDTAVGGNGTDQLYGGTYGDRLIGGDDADRVYGGSGKDTIYGNEAGDRLGGGTGSDLIYGGKDNDVLFGNEDGDTLYGNSGRDTAYGGDGNDKVYGGSSNDTLYGNNGRDTVYGNEGNDEVYGNDGDDLLNGGKGNDRLAGGKGDDTLVGASGADRFVFADGWDADQVTGFSITQDTLVLNDNLWTGMLSEAQVMDSFADVVAGDMVFDFGGGDTLVLTGVTDLEAVEARLSFI